MSKIDELAKMIAEPMQAPFRQFVQTGEAPDDFLTYLEHDASAQQAVERAFDAQAAALGGLAKAIHEDNQAGFAQRSVDPAAHLASLVEQVALLPEAARTGLLVDVATNVRNKVGNAGAVRARTALSELEQAFSSLVK